MAQSAPGARRNDVARSILSPIVSQFRPSPRAQRHATCRALARLRYLVGMFTVLLTHCTFAAAPSVGSVTGVRSPDGKETELIVIGDDLGSATALWTSFAGVIPRAGQLGEKRAVFRFARIAPIGVFAARVFGSNGVSEAHLFMIDDLPSADESKTNKSRATAQSIRIGTSVHGVCDELDFDWFKFYANKGERVAIEVVASRLGSRLDSVLRVTDARGRQLAHVDDVHGLRGDSYITFVAANAGDHFIEIRDVNYGGGSEFLYRLRIGDFPLVTTTFPIAVEHATGATVELSGPAGTVGESKVFLPSNSPVGGVSIAGRKGATFAKALIVTNSEVIEREPNDQKPIQKMQRFAGISGRFDKANDRDVYEFMARKGERLEFRANTRSVGSACDIAMRLESAKGAELARSNPSAADEGIVVHTFASDGTYRLVVEEVTGAFGANCIYRIIIQRAAGFALTLDTDRVHVDSGKTFELKVTCARGDYKGPVTLAVDGIEGLVMTNNVIAEGKTNITMKVILPESLSPGTPSFLTVIGNAESDRSSEVRVRASTAPALRRRFPQLLYVPVELDGVIALGVTSAR